MKKLLIIALLAFFCIPFAQAQTKTFIIEKKQYRSMVDDSTGLYYFYYYGIDSAGDYTRIPFTAPLFETTGSFSGNGLAFAKKDGKYGYLDTLGHTVIPFLYGNATDFSDGMAIVFTNCKTGIIDGKGNLTMLKKEYEQVFSFKEGRAIVVDKGLSGAIDNKGNEVIAPQYKWMGTFEHGLSVFTDTVTYNKGALDTMGNIVFQPIYGGIQPFYNGYSDIWVRDMFKKHPIQKHGLAKSTGEIVIPLEYSSITTSSYSGYFNDYYDDDYDYNENYISSDDHSKFIVVATKHRRGKSPRYGGIFRFPRRVVQATAYTNTGTQLVTTHKKRISILNQSQAYYKSDKGVVLVRINGQLDTLQNIMAIGNRYASVKNDTVYEAHTYNGKSGLISTRGGFVFKPEYDKLYHERNRDIVVGVKGKTIEVFNDSTLKLIKSFPGNRLNTEYFTVYNSFHENRIKLYTVKLGNKMGLLDSAFNELLPTVYDDIDLRGKWVIIKKDGLSGVLDSKLNVIIKPEYTAINKTGNGYYGYRYNTYFSYGLFSVEKNRKVGVIDTAGNVLLPAVYSKVVPTHFNMAGYYYVQKDKKWSILNSEFKQVSELKFDNVTDNGTYFICSRNKKKALFNEFGKQLTDYKYTSIGDSRYNDSRIGVIIKHKAGLIDPTGKEIIPCNFKRVNGYGKYVFCHNKNQTQLYDINGKLIIGPGYNYLSMVSDRNTIIAHKGDNKGLINPANEVLLPFIYSNIYVWEEEVYKLVRTEGKKKFYGVATLDGKIIIPADYSSNQINYYRNTIVLEVDDKRYFYNAKGETVNDCYIDKSIGGQY